MYSEHQEEYRRMNTGAWATEDKEHCPCRGAGWCLSDLDTWHRCPVHGRGKMHPKMRDLYEEECAENERAWKEDPVVISDIVVVGKPLTSPPQRANSDDLPF